jgi:uncharacterized RDD family membrane protein YckC
VTVSPDARQAPFAGDTPRAAGAGQGAHGEPADYSVFTPERVRLRYDVADVGSRAAAALLDSAVQTALFFAFWIVLGVGSIGSSSWFTQVRDTWLITVLVILVFLGVFFLLWGYYLVFELVWNGQTPGKRLLDLRVIRENGYPIRAPDAVVRNLIRVVDGPPFGFAVGVIAMLLNERAKRLGDFAAGTIVVREARRQRLEQLPGFLAPAPPAVPVAAATPAVTTPGAALTGRPGAGEERPAATPLNADDATLVRDFLVRRHLMDRAPRAALAQRLATYLTQRYGLHLRRSEGVDGPAGPEGHAAHADERFLETLAGA